MSSLTAKIILIGNSSVGKTSIMMRFVSDTFEEHEATIGVDFRRKSFTHNNQTVNLQIWDTSGQEKFRSVTPKFYRDVDGVILVYDICDRNSFLNLHSWLSEVSKYVDREYVTILVGNKIDMENERCIAYSEGDAFAKRYSMMFIETSAKTAEGVDDAFTELVRKILQLPTFMNKLTAKSDKDKINLSEQAQPPSACSC